MTHFLDYNLHVPIVMKSGNLNILESSGLLIGPYSVLIIFS